MRIWLPLLVLLAAAGASGAASAELYRWVDARGVTNYSSEPPPPAATANKLSRVANTISVYTPDENLMQAVKATRERALRAAAEPEPQRAAVGRIEVPPQSGYEQCVQAGRLGCEDIYASYYPAYFPHVAVLPRYGVQPTRFVTRRASADVRVRHVTARR
jgi:hypothetical protein